MMHQRMSTSEVLGRLRRGLVVSCQAPDGTPLQGPVFMAAMARAADRGGAVGIRAEGAEDIAAIRTATTLPIIGIRKLHRPPSPVYITGRYADAASVVRAGADAVALDATLRERPGGEQLRDIIARTHDELGVPVVADVDSIAAGDAAVHAGADVLATTLSGYTEESARVDGPDLVLVRDLCRLDAVPVIAEGRIRTPGEAAAALHEGAWAVVVGTGITNPTEITRRFTDAIAGAAGVTRSEH